MKLTETHEDIRSLVRKFVDHEINPHCDEWEEAKIFPAHELFKKMGDLGLLGVNRAEEYGGLGLDYTHNVILAEELGRCRSAAVSMAIGVQTDMCTPALANFGSDSLKRNFLAPAIAGDMVGCVGVSEVGAGSDVANITTTARKDGGDYVINGGKMWITNGFQADWMCCLANTSDGKAHLNKSLIMIPMDAKGIERSRKLHKLGMWASDTAQIYFDDVRVPQENLIGGEGFGFMMQMAQFQEERLWGAANVIKGLENCIQDTIDYAGQRQAFGQSILDNQVVHHKLAELQTEVELLRALVYRTTELYVAEQEKGELMASNEVVKLASMCKLKAGRLAREVADSCLQYWGGMGFMWESSVARFYRDGRLISIGGGADEVMLNIIAKMMGTLPRKKKG
ncbi:MAG: acyl-CoA dehydrogenase family protein [Alphaproteobacteria bacterium]|nr:acyl-CoA dehydrogenase family protein [Alphaproteobacteria bacterium]